MIVIAKFVSKLLLHQILEAYDIVVINPQLTYGVLYRICSFQSLFPTFNSQDFLVLFHICAWIQFSFLFTFVSFMQLY